MAVIEQPCQLVPALPERPQGSGCDKENEDIDIAVFQIAQQRPAGTVADRAGQLEEEFVRITSVEVEAV